MVKIPSIGALKIQGGIAAVDFQGDVLEAVKLRVGRLGKTRKISGSCFNLKSSRRYLGSDDVEQKDQSVNLIDEKTCFFLKDTMGVNLSRNHL